MNRLFVRFFVLVMLSVTVATAPIYVATSYLFGEPLDDIARRQFAAQISCWSTTLPGFPG